MPYEHADELRRCLLECDPIGIRRLWQHIAPHLPQPATNDEALTTIHLARMQMKNISERAREYSRDWLKEHDRRKKSMAVGIAVGMCSEWQTPYRAERFLNVRGEMEHAVTRSLQDGLDLASDADNDEIKRRMHQARLKA